MFSGLIAKGMNAVVSLADQQAAEALRLERAAQEQGSAIEFDGTPNAEYVAQLVARSDEFGGATEAEIEAVLVETQNNLLFTTRILRKRGQQQAKQESAGDGGGASSATSSTAAQGSGGGDTKVGWRWSILRVRSQNRPLYAGR